MKFFKKLSKLCEPSDLDPRFKETVFMVEATSYETHTLWQQYSREGAEFCTHGRFEPSTTRYHWEQDSAGWLYTVGWIGKDPVCVSFHWSRLNGHLVCFYHPTSRMVDHDLVEKYVGKIFKRTWDNGTRAAYCDASNFHHCLQHVRDLK